MMPPSNVANAREGGSCSSVSGRMSIDAKQRADCVAHEPRTSRTRGIFEEKDARGDQ
jgi:hypothetical protein